MKDRRENSYQDNLTWDLLSESYIPESTSNEKLLLLLNRSGGLSPYSHSFGDEEQDSQILAGLISAMTNFMGQLIGEEDASWSTMYGSDSILIVEIGEWMIGALVASRETNEARSKLRTVIREFEDSFEILKNADGVDNSIFSSFDDYVRRIFVSERITPRTEVTKNQDWRSSLEKLNRPSLAFNVSKLLLGFEETESVENIASIRELSFEDIIEDLSHAYWQGLIRMKFMPCDRDILELTEKVTPLLFRKSNPLNISVPTLSVIAKLDGVTPLSNIIQDMTSQDLELLFDKLGTLMNKGLIQRISIEKRLVFLNESILSILVSTSVSKIGTRDMDSMFQNILNVGRIYHPWINRIILTDDMHVKCILEESMNNSELDDMCDALEYFIREMVEQITTRCGKRTADTFVEDAQSRASLLWNPYLENVVI